MRYQTPAFAFVAGLAIGVSSAWAQVRPPQESSPQQQQPAVTSGSALTFPTSSAQSLSNEAQQDMGTAQLLFKLGQMKAQLAQAMEQSEAKDAYWKVYVEGINQALAGHTMSKLPSEGAKPAESK